MLRNRIRRRSVPELNTTSTADISFMLLTFFLVTTSMDNDKGLVFRLPPPSHDTEVRVDDVKRRNVMMVEIDAGDRITCDGDAVTADELRCKVKDFVENKADSPQMPEKVRRDIHGLGVCSITANHLISVHADRNTSYDAYFAVQNAIAAAYNELRDELALAKFGHSYKECGPAERAALAEYYPQRVSELEIDGKGGER